MKRLILPIAFLSLIVVAALIALVMFNQDNGSSSSTKKELISEYAANENVSGLTMTDENSLAVKLIDINETTLLTFWSVGCTECKQALTDLKDYKTKHPEFNVTLVNFRNTPADAKAKLAEYGIEFPNYYDRDAELFNELSASIPSSYFIKNNNIIYYFPGRIGTDFMYQLLTEFQN